MIEAHVAHGGHGDHCERFVHFVKVNVAVFDGVNVLVNVAVFESPPPGPGLLMVTLPVVPVAGYVVVFDDVTDLAQAQRDAAWGEVARRLAHAEHGGHAVGHGQWRLASTAGLPFAGRPHARAQGRI